jgi:acetyl-CoA carboxylase biotin carboxyl carrier protein
MDINEIDRLMQRFEQSSLCELELTLGGDSLRMRKPEARIAVSADVPKAGIDTAVVNTQMSEKEAGLPIQTDGNEADAQLKAENQIPEGCKVTAPLVGTFYRAPQPGAEPYVEVGKRVQKGDAIGMIEAMKIMNEIPAPTDGVVVSIEADDAQFVEFEQVLVVIKEN